MDLRNAVLVILERLIIYVCSEVHLQLFETVFRQLSPELRQAIDRLLMVPDGEQRSYFYHLKEYPPAPSISICPRANGMSPFET